MEKIFTLTVMMFSFSGILLLGLEIPEELGEAYRFEYRVIIIQNPLIWISYPAFIDLPNVDALNAAVEKFVEEMWEKWKEELAYAQKNLVKYHQQVDYYLTFEINWLSEDLVSIIFQDSAYTGGAHGQPSIKVFNYNLKRKRIIHLKDLFKEEVDYKRQINEKVKKWLEYALTIEEFETIKDDDQFSINRLGIEIILQVYEYTPYAYGSPRILICYDELQGFNDWFLNVIKKGRWY